MMANEDKKIPETNFHITDVNDPRFNCGDKEKDFISLIDCAYDIMELWNPSEDELYNKALRTAWLKRAKELGATSSI